MKLQELFQTEPICERGDISKIVKGSLAYHGLLGAVRVLNISGATVEVAQIKGGKHAKVQLSSLSLDDINEAADLEEAIFPDSSVGHKLHQAKSFVKSKIDTHAAMGATAATSSAVAAAGLTTANMVPSVLLFSPILGSQVLLLAGTYGAAVLSMKGINWLAQKIFGTAEEALDFAYLHLNAFKAGKTQFSFQGKQYKVKLNSDTDVKSLQKKIEDLDIRARSKKS